MKTILILGAGTGGIVTAREISKFSGNEDDINLIKILVFEKEEVSVFSPSLPWVMVGKRKPGEISQNTDKLNASGLEIIKGEIERIDPEEISITVKGRKYHGDYMVVSLGIMQIEREKLTQYGHNFFTLKGAEKFYTKLKEFSGNNIAILVSSLPFKSPAAPYEAAMLIEDFVRNNISGQTTVSLYTPETGPMEFAGIAASLELKKLLEKKGIKYYPNHELKSVTKNKLNFKNGDSHSFDLLAFTPDHHVPNVIKNSPLSGSSGWIDVDIKTLETKFKNVYAIGDVTSITTENNKPFPKIGVFARQQATVVAHNISRKIAKLEPNDTFIPEGKYFIEAGEGKASEAGGQFSTSSKPGIILKNPAPWGHYSKWWNEKFWFFKNF